MFRIQIISVFIVLFVTKLQGYPSPGQNVNYEYVDENGQVIEGGGNGPPEGYEVIDEVDNQNKGRPQQATAEVVEDVDISGFDVKGNYIGSPVSSGLAQINSKSSKLDQEYYEEDEDDDEESFSKKGNAYQSRYVQPPPKPTKDPYKVIEESYPGIFERLKKSETDKKSNYKSTWNNNEDLNKEFDKAAQSGIFRPKERGWTVGNMNQELDKLVQSDIPESKDKSSWDYFRYNNLAQSSERKLDQGKNGWSSRDPEAKAKNEWSTSDAEAKGKGGWSNKDPEAQDDLDNKSLNQETNKLAQSRFPKTKPKPNQNEYINGEPSTSVTDNSDKVIDNSVKVIEDKVNSTTESTVQHMDVHPGMDGHNKVVIQQLSGGSNGTEVVKITEQNILSANTNSTTGAHQDKYKDRLLKPRRSSRILARYKVIIPVIVPNLRLRMPKDGVNHVDDTTKISQTHN